MAPKLLQKTITISPLVVVGTSILMLIATVVIALGAMNRSAGGDSKQIEINTGILKSVVETRLPEIYSEIGQLKSVDGELRVVDMQNSTRYESIDKRLDAIQRVMENLQNPSRIQYPVKSQTIKKE